MEEELDEALKKIKSRKAANLDEIFPNVEKMKKFDILFQFCNAVYKQNTIDKLTKNFILIFPKKGDLRITKNYRDIASQLYPT